MTAFWIAAALMSAATAGLMLRCAAGASLHAARKDEDPILAVYRRQLGEVDDMAERGLIAPDEVRSAHTEAARRLLSAADAGLGGAWTAQAGGHRAVLWVAGLVPIAALGVYLLIGSPQLPDQPYRARVAAWRKGDPGDLNAAQMAAVMQAIVAERPGDLEPLVYLARAQAAAGDNFSAERNLQKALRLAPRRSELWGFYGQLIAADANTDTLPDDARVAFQKALALDPKAPEPQYFLGRGQIAAGDVAGGLTMWRNLAGGLPANDPRRPTLDQQIAVVERTGVLPAQTPDGQPDQAGGGDQRVFIGRMVQDQVASLAANPDDPAGWARLVRSYSVLGDITRRDTALAKARSLFKDRPQDLAAIEAAQTTRP